MGLKLLRFRADSANLVAFYSAMGQPDNWNFFANSFYNHADEGKGPGAEAFAKLFGTVTPYTRLVGLSDFASKDEAGRTVDSPKFPFRLRFEPHPDVKNLFPSTLVDNDPNAYVKQL